MQISGIQKITLVDFPDHVAATVFTRGCSFRCGFCHNPELVLPEKFEGLIPEQEIFDFLESRYGKLSGICITGGEPLLQPDIDKFISHVKALGFDIKLDTNGSFPDKLEQIIKDGDIDYIAIDLKGPISKYAEIVGLNLKSQISNLKNKEINASNEAMKQSSNELTQKIQRSIKLIMNSGIDYEFRTTVCHPYHEVTDFEAMGELIAGAPRYYLQNFVHSKHVLEDVDFQPFTDKELDQAATIMRKYVGEVGIR